jgi:hypothetical protein
MNKLKIVDVIIGGWLAIGGFIAMCYFHAKKDKLPEWMPYRRFAYLCIFLIIGGVFLATFDLLFPTK